MENVIETGRRARRADQNGGDSGKGAEWRNLVADVEDLVKKVAHVDDEDIARIRSKVEATLAKAKGSANDGIAAIRGRAEEVSEATDEYVHENPWAAIGVAAAVGIIIGAAFGKIVDSLVKDVIMPPIGLLLGKVDFSNLFLVLREGSTAGPYVTLETAQKAGAVTFNYGMFINTVITFLIVAFAVFVLIRTINRLREREDEKKQAPAAEPPEEVKLLREIRDTLKDTR